MHPSTSLLLSIFLSFSLFSAKPEDAANYGGDGGVTPSPTSNSCNNCTICQYPCRSEPPPPSGDLQPSATPPPPPLTEANCPPAAPVQCCGGQYSYPPPMPYYNQPPVPYYTYPYNNYSGLSGPSMKPCDAATWLYAVFSCLIVLFISKV